jgi:hypothetical protein
MVKRLRPFCVFPGVLSGVESEYTHQSIGSRPDIRGGEMSRPFLLRCHGKSLSAI